MLPKEHLDVKGFNKDFTQIWEGKKKNIYETAKNGRRLAVKFFQNSPEALIREFNAYQMFFETDLKPFIPKPVELLPNKKAEYVAFSVERNEGDTLVSKRGKYFTGIIK